MSRGGFKRLFGKENVEWVVIGLGNPGSEYENNRHNIGVTIVRRIMKESSAQKPERARSFRFMLSHVCGKSVAFVIPRVYMNASGRAAAEASGKFRVKTKEIIIVHDDMDLAIGRIKVKQGGGSGGHRGIESVRASLETDDFVRIRVGVGRPVDGMDAAEYVLSDFKEEEEVFLEWMESTAAAAIETVISKGISCAMDSINGKSASFDSG